MKGNDFLKRLFLNKYDAIEYKLYHIPYDPLIEVYDINFEMYLHQKYILPVIS